MRALFFTVEPSFPDLVPRVEIGISGCPARVVRCNLQTCNATLAPFCLHPLFLFSPFQLNYSGSCFSVLSSSVLLLLFFSHVHDEPPSELSSPLHPISEDGGYSVIIIFKHSCLTRVQRVASLGSACSELSKTPFRMTIMEQCSNTPTQKSRSLISWKLHISQRSKNPFRKKKGKEKERPMQEGTK